MRKQSKILSILLTISLTICGSAAPVISSAADEINAVETAGITVTPDPALGTVDGSKEMPSLLFRTQSEGGTATKNISKNNYTVWGQAVNSYLEENEDGSFLRIEHVDSEIIVEKYASDLKKAESVTKLTLPLPEYGGYFTGANARYLVCGEENPEEADDKEVVRIIKYDKNWNELDHLSIYGSNTYNPFAAGSLQMTEMNGVLYVHGSHTMYASKKDGLHHQANMDFAVNEETMELITQHTNVSYSGEGGHGYVSHSFCQRIAQDGNDIYLFDHGDAYPRCAQLQKIDAKLDTVSKALEVLVFDGQTGDNKTGASIGGVEVVGDNVFTAGNSTEQFGELYNPSTYRRNIWVSIVDKNMETSQKFIWLTAHENRGEWNARTPYLIPASDGSCYVIWEDVDETCETIGSFNRYNLVYALTKIAKVKPDGTIDGEIHSIYGRLSDCKPVITSDQKLVWYTTEDASPLFYSLDLNNLSSYEFAGFGNIEKCSVTLASDSYDYKNPGYEKNNIGPEVLAVTYGDLPLIKGIDYDVTYSGNANVGTGYIYIIGKGLFKDPTSDEEDKMIKIPFQVNYPEEPEDTPEPTDTPFPTKTPSATQVPSITEQPPVTPSADASTEPSVTDTPLVTEKPSVSPSVDTTQKPSDTPEQPFVSPSAAVSQKPSASETPSVTKQPSASPVASASQKPAATKTPSATKKPSVSSSTVPSKKPAASTTPKKTPYPRKTATPAKTSDPVTPAKMTDLSLVNLTGKRLMITWARQDAASGYQIQYAMNKKFTLKKKTVSCSKYRSMKLIYGLKKKKTYYVRIRAYAKSDTGNLYGKWSKKVKCKIKK